MKFFALSALGWAALLRPTRPANASAPLLRAGNASGHVLHASRRSRSTVNATRKRYEPPKQGVVSAVYYSTYSGDYVSQINVVSAETLSAPPADDIVWIGSTQVGRGDCALQLEGLGMATDSVKRNLRLAELAVCEALHPSPTKVKLRVPLPYDDGDAPYTSAATAVAAYSSLSGRASDFSNVAVVGGLKLTDNGVQLGGVWSLERKLENAYTQGFSTVVIPADAADEYYTTSTYKDMGDPLAWSRHFSVELCDSLTCVANIALV